jgi:C-1 hydroxylase
MSLEETKAIIRSHIEALNKQDLAYIDDFVAPDYVNHTRQFQGQDGFKQFMTTHLKTFPDFHVTIEDIIAEGEKVCLRIIVTGTHEGEYRGLAPTGKKMKIRGVQIYRIVDGKAVEGWTDYNFYPDQLDLLKQLGVIEYTEKGKKLFSRN